MLLSGFPNNYFGLDAMNNLGKSTSDYTISRSDFFAIIESKQRPVDPIGTAEDSSLNR